jgi:hypothetical protein
MRIYWLTMTSGRIALSFLLICAVPLLGRAQQPFVTDDADVTQKGKFHFQLTNELDRLQRSSLPVKYQNGTRATLGYGLIKNVEISITGQFLTLVSEGSPRLVGGIGDTAFAFKYNFRRERVDSRLPALTITGFVQLPTGDSSRSLGSGVTDYGISGIVQKTFRGKNIFRVNGGYLFAGNTLTGVLGISRVRGHVFTGSASYVRKINDRLQLGGELSGAVTSNFELSQGQLQTQLGGNYQINKKTTFDFGVIAGRFAASPRFGLQLGFSRDF